ncbi:hypothetical protein C0J52_23871 [Blattella germanica]|nr:hypothetical protein C0J52_23871 [Blattella germanica]
MAAKRCSGDNEAELRKMLESVLDSDCEYSEFSDDETESEECISNRDSSSSAFSSDEVIITMMMHQALRNALVLRRKNDSDWNWTKSDNNPIIDPFTDNSGVCKNLLNKFDSDPPSELSIFSEFREPLFDKICNETKD